MERHEDVLRLLKHGEKVMAIRCYRTVHKVSLKEAKEKVEALANQAA
jgi:ribosomal protein L7/L12